MSLRGPPLESTRNKFGCNRGDETSGSGARTNFAALESELEIIQKKLTATANAPRLPGTAVGIIFATLMLDNAELAASGILRV